MPSSPEAADRWHDAAARASFAIYEASGIGERWAGGFAHDGTHVEVITLIDADEVSVDSSQPERLSGENGRRSLLAELLWRHVVRDDGALSLPYSLRIEPDDRAITVDGVEYTARGMRIAGAADWVGTMRIGDVTVTIRTASPAALELRTCDDPSSLPEFPPVAD